MKKLQNLPRKYQILIILYAIIVCGLFFCENYDDLLITTHHGISFWECLFSGRITDFYDINYQIPLWIRGRSLSINAASYDFIIYIIFAIWDFPLWVQKALFGVQNPMDTFIGLCWAKTIGLFFWMASGVMFYKIANKFNKDKDFVLSCTLLLITSLYAIDYVFIMGQYDSIAIFFVLAGLYNYLNGKKCLGLLLFSVAIPIKMFAFFAFVIIILYIEKNILKILANMALVYLPTLICRLVFPFAGANNVEALWKMIFFTNPWSMGISFFSVFIVVFAIVAIVSYIIGKKDDSYRKLIYLLFLSYAAFGLCAFNLPYWLLYFVPFMYLIFVMNKGLFELNLCLDAVGTVFILVTQMVSFYWAYSSTLVNQLLVSRLFERPVKEYHIDSLLIDILGYEGCDQIILYIPMVGMSLYIACMLVMVVANYLYTKKAFALDVQVKENLKWFGISARYIFSVVLMILPVVFYLR